MFPDWEMYFHHYEDHYTDYFFEFLFKPVKFFYTLVNAIKAIFRQKFTLKKEHIPKDEIPYIFLLICFVVIYMIFFNNTAFVMKMFNGIITMNYDLLVNDGIKGFSTAIISLCFLDTFIEKMIGYSISKIMKLMFKYTALNPEGIKNAPEPPNEATWINWIGNTNSTFIMICKVIFTIIYWLIKYVITYQLIPLSVYIIYFYFLYNLLLGIYNNTDDNVGIFDKIELISRIFYTKFYNVSGTNNTMFLIKTIFWIAYTFMFEIVFFSILIVGLQSYAKYINDPDIKNVLFFTYLSLIIAVCVWGIYKYKFGLKTLDENYAEKNDSNPEEYPNNKRIEINRFFNCKDIVEEKSGNSFFAIFMGSDSINEEAMNQYLLEKQQKYEQQQADAKDPTKQKKNKFEIYSEKFMSGFEKAGNFFKEKSSEYSQKANEYTNKISETAPNEIELAKKYASNLKNSITEAPSKLSEGFTNGLNNLKNMFKNQTANPK